MADLVNMSPLEHRDAPQGLSITMREMAGRGMIDLRGLSTDRRFMTAAKKAMGFDLPKEPRTSASWGDRKALWLSIDQWLILCPAAQAADLAQAISAAIAGIHAFAVDVSTMRAVIRVEGPGAAEVLMKGTSLDLIGSEWQPGRVRRMRFAEIAALLHQVESEAFDIYVFRSYADYAWDFLRAAARAGTEVRLFAKQGAPLTGM